MGVVFACCGRKKKPKQNNELIEKPKPPETNQDESTNVSESNTNIHSSEEILNDNIKAQITQGIEENITKIQNNYQVEHDRIVEEMKSKSPEPYLGLQYTEYPEKNGHMVKDMAQRVVTSKEEREKLINQIDEFVESSFQSGTADWNSVSRELARSDVRKYIETQVNEAFDRVVFP